MTTIDCSKIVLNCTPGGNSINGTVSEEALNHLKEGNVIRVSCQSLGWGYCELTIGQTEKTSPIKDVTDGLIITHKDYADFFQKGESFDMKGDLVLGYLDETKKKFLD